MRLLIADNQRLMLRVLRVSLEEAEGFEIVGEVMSANQLLPRIAEVSPDLVLLDARMPGINGLMALELIRDRHPEVKVVVISGIDDTDVIEAAAGGGAVAFVAKTIDPRDLAAALRQAAAETVFQVFGTPTEDKTSAAKAAGLSERELSILKALGVGRSNKQIAEQLRLAENTVKFHLTTIYRKLGVSNRTEAVRYAYQHSLVESPLLEEVNY